MKVDFNDILTLGLICVVFLWILFVMKKNSVFSAIKQYSAKDMMLGGVILVCSYIAYSIFLCNGEYFFASQGNKYDSIIDELLKYVFNDNTTFISFYSFIVFSVFMSVLEIALVQKIVCLLKLYPIKMTYIVAFVIINRFMYINAEYGWSLNILSILSLCLLVAIADFALERKKKKICVMLFMSCIFIAVLVINWKEYSDILQIAYNYLVVVESLILAFILKYVQILRKIWKRLLILVCYIVIFMLNWIVI